MNKETFKLRRTARSFALRMLRKGYQVSMDDTATVVSYWKI